MNFLKRHWKAFVTGACGVASVVPVLIPGAAPIGIAVGAACTLLTAAHVLDARDVAQAKEQLGAGIAGVADVVEQLGERPDATPAGKGRKK